MILGCFTKQNVLTLFEISPQTIYRVKCYPDSIRNHALGSFATGFLTVKCEFSRHHRWLGVEPEAEVSASQNQRSVPMHLPLQSTPPILGSLREIPFLCFWVRSAVTSRCRLISKLDSCTTFKMLKCSRTRSRLCQHCECFDL